MDASGFSDQPDHEPAPLRPEFYLQAAERLIDATGPMARQAAQRLIDAGPDSGISFAHAFATIDPDVHAVRELAIAVPAPGRSALVFLSRPNAGETRSQERAACARALTSHLAGLPGQPFDIAQSLPGSNERWAVDALTDARWQIVGTLAYMRRPVGPQDAPKPSVLRGRQPQRELPDGVEVEPISIPDPGSPRHEDLVEALNDSYSDTLDCPALCGMRRTSDILASHAAIGRPELALWSIVSHEGRPAGAMLLACLPEQRCYELVYIGLGPSLRGRGLGESLLESAIEQIAARLKRAPRSGRWSLTCAVDTANAPAVRLYERVGFMSFDRRVACVHGLDRVLSTGALES
ncbi:MAG: GNAT family N-acetyltransferase [Phycisphaerales bacterium]|jgi:ribosomal protein S18 acetylase RimI-like enzyme